jgi:hypothetical protein
MVLCTIEVDSLPWATFAMVKIVSLDQIRSDEERESLP